MPQQPTLMQIPQPQYNPQTFTLFSSQLETKKKKKKLKVKKYIKSPNKHHQFLTDDPLYDVLNHQEMVDTNQLNFGPWINEQPKSKHDFLPNIDHNKTILNFNQQTTTNKQSSKQQHLLNTNKPISKSQQLLTKYNYSTTPTKLQKISNRNTTFLKVPVWNAFIQEKTIHLPNTFQNSISYRKQIVKQRLTSMNFQVGNKKTNLNLVSIGSTQDLNGQKRLQFKHALDQDGSNFLSTKIDKFHGYSSTKMDLLKKIKANAVVYNYCYDNENRLTPTIEQPANQTSPKTPIQNLQKNLKRRKHEVFQKKLNEMELKLVVPEQRRKLVFLPHSQRSLHKQTVSKYTFMDLLQMRSKGK